jgi:hypothetical protein
VPEAAGAMRRRLVCESPGTGARSTGVAGFLVCCRLRFRFMQGFAGVGGDLTSIRRIIHGDVYRGNVVMRQSGALAIVSGGLVSLI